MDIVKDKLKVQADKERFTKKHLFLEYDKQERELLEKKERELEQRRWKYNSQKEKEEFLLLNKIQTMLNKNLKT